MLLCFCEIADKAASHRLHRRWSSLLLDAWYLPSMYRQLTAELIPDPEEGGFTARVPDIPAYGEGETEEEAIADLKEALQTLRVISTRNVRQSVYSGPPATRHSGAGRKTRAHAAASAVRGHRLLATASFNKRRVSTPVGQRPCPAPTRMLFRLPTWQRDACHAHGRRVAGLRTEGRVGGSHRRCPRVAHRRKEEWDRDSRVFNHPVSPGATISLHNTTGDPVWIRRFEIRYDRHGRRR